MHLGISTLLDFYRAHRADDALILATVIATKGSTYRKPGAMMLIARDGSFRGLISGGCIESDLAEHAKQVFSDGKTRKISYDLSATEDLVWGLGIGCDGVIELMLQRLQASNNFGLLGPRARRDRLISDINAGEQTEHVHVHGPAGLDIGAEMPESIALAIIAEIHACLNRCKGSELTPADLVAMQA